MQLVLTSFSTGSLTLKAELLLDEDESEPWDEPTGDISHVVVSDPSSVFPDTTFVWVIGLPRVSDPSIEFSECTRFRQKALRTLMKETHLLGKIFLGQTI